MMPRPWLPSAYNSRLVEPMAGWNRWLRVVEACNVEDRSADDDSDEYRGELPEFDDDTAAARGVKFATTIA